MYDTALTRNEYASGFVAETFPLLWLRQFTLVSRSSSASRALSWMRLDLLEVLGPERWSRDISRDLTDRTRATSETVDYLYQELSVPLYHVQSSVGAPFKAVSRTS